jgi:hypothetical protein
MKKSKIRSVDNKIAGLNRVFIIKLGLIPSEKSTTISLLLDNLKSAKVAAMKNVTGSV